ncbi:MAG: response regulator transcription factor, partial [Armatimonadetes bacterium]|nr:response regulator transcription factor [Armatimonadota bacterium]
KAVRAARQGTVYLCAEVAHLASDGAGFGLLPVRADPLTPREREVLQAVAEGLTTLQIAARMFISRKTVEAHRRNIVRKLGLRTVAELTKYAVRHGISPG